MQAPIDCIPMNATGQRLAKGLTRPSQDELARTLLLAGTDLGSLAELLEVCEVRHLEPDEILIATGTANTALYIILSGRLRVHHESTEGDAAGVLEAGESVGELSLFDQRPTACHAVADVSTRVLVMPQEVLWMCVESSHAIARNLLACLGQRLRAADAPTVRNHGMQRQFLRQTVVDEITGLHNRRWFENALKRHAVRSRMGGRALSLILLDIDRFDRTNRAFGEEAGDAVLRAVAHHLEQFVRPTDLVARYGADGFAIALTDATLENAHIVAGRLQADIASAVIGMDDGSILPPVTVTCGTAELQGGTGVEGLVADATSALKEARRAKC